jgi:hypothetical protein
VPARAIYAVERSQSKGLTDRQSVEWGDNKRAGAAWQWPPVRCQCNAQFRTAAVGEWAVGQRWARQPSGDRALASKRRP